MPLRILSVLFALVAVVAMLFAIAGMVRGDQSPGRGWLLRVIALACFGVTVALNVAAH